MPRPERTGEKEFSAAELKAAEARVRRAVRAPGMVFGIHNYCDRWCERCPQTARCSVFQIEQARAAARGGKARDLENQEFWDELAESFAVAMQMVRSDAKKRGVDLNSPEVMATARANERQRARRAARESSALRRAATAYRKAAEVVLDRLPEELRSTEAALNTQARLAVGDPDGAAAEILDALEVVRWYLFFIEVKLARAAAGRVDEAIEGASDFPRDADGSAKIALIAIDRSLAAWVRLRERLDGEADAMLDLLVQLEKLRRIAEREFPRARAFRRPGFD